MKQSTDYAKHISLKGWGQGRIKMTYNPINGPAKMMTETRSHKQQKVCYSCIQEQWKRALKHLTRSGMITWNKLMKKAGQLPYNKYKWRKEMEKKMFYISAMRTKSFIHNNHLFISHVLQCTHYPNKIYFI